MIIGKTHPTLLCEIFKMDCIMSLQYYIYQLETIITVFRTIIWKMSESHNRILRSSIQGDLGTKPNQTKFTFGTVYYFAVQIFWMRKIRYESYDNAFWKNNLILIVLVFIRLDRFRWRMLETGVCWCQWEFQDLGSRMIMLMTFSM